MEILGYAFLLFLSAIMLFYFYCKKKFKYFEKKHIPHRKPILPFGNLLDFVFCKSYPASYFANLYKEFNAPCIGFYSLTKPYLLIKDPELIGKILVKDFSYFSNRCFFSNNKVESLLSNTLLGMKNPEWKILRRKLSSVFTSGQLKLMFPLIVECSKNMEEYLSTQLNNNLELKVVALKFTTDVIITCAFGLDINSFGQDTEFIANAGTAFATTKFETAKALSYIFAPSLVQIFKYPFFKKKSTDFFRVVFDATMKDREMRNFQRNDLVDLLKLLKNEKDEDSNLKFNDDVIFAQAFTFFGASLDSSSSTIAFTLHELGVNPKIQQKLRQEIVREIEKCGGLTYEAIQNMSYLDMVVSETLRKYPATPLLNRECVKDYNSPEMNFSIEKGTAILISQFGLHWDHQYFPNPEVYDPERFSNENHSNIPKYVYLPFGDGPRICLGERFALLSTKMGIIQAIRNFRIEINSNTQHPLEFDKLPVLRAKHGVNLTLRKL